MKIRYLAAALMLLCQTAFAEIKLESKESVTGSWKLVQTRAGGGTKEAMERQDTWI